MYTSPIDVIYGEMQMQVEGEIYKAVQKVGVNVDKEELLKALQYDRGQYEQGYKDGYARAIDEFAETLNKKITVFVLKHKDNLDFASGIGVAWSLVDEMAEQMKEGVNNG